MSGRTRPSDCFSVDAWSSGVDEPPAGKRPVLPCRFLETNHDFFRVKAGLRECGHQFFEQFLLDLDAASHRPQDLDQGKFLVSPGLDVGVRWVEAEAFRLELENPLK